MKMGFKVGMRLILVRHGQSEANLARKIQGQGDGDLTERGRKEAQLAAIRMETYAPIDVIYTSPLKRALITATTIAERLDLRPVVMDDLREIHLGGIDGLNSEESEARFPGLLARWANDDLTLVFPDGEALIDSYQRAVEVMRRIVRTHPAKSVVAVSHGGLLSAYLSYTLDGQFSVKRIYELRNCSITAIDFDDHTGSPQLVTYNEHDHLIGLA